MKLLNKFGIAAGLAASLSVIGVNEAEAASLNLTFTGTNTSATGTGTITFDDAALAPNTFTGTFDSLTAFEANFTGLPTAPSSTSFNLSDLTSWVFVTDSNASITDINFFARGKTNTDGYSVEGTAPNTFNLSNANGVVDTFRVSVTQAAEPTSIPEPSSALGSALFVTLFGVNGVL
ncbi:MAG: hypothetical protein AAFS12_04925, partial [Cyanobacteria bacterium J06632_19]